MKLFSYLILFSISITSVFASTNNTCNVVVPFAAGGPADMYARLMQRVNPDIVRVENRPGAYSAPAVTFLENNKNFILLSSPGMYSPKNPSKNTDLEAVEAVILTNLIGVTNSDITFDDLLTKPLNVGIAVLGGSGQILAAQLKERNPLLQIIPHGGDSKSLPLLMNKDIHLNIMNSSNGEQWINDFKFKSLFEIPLGKQTIVKNGVTLDNYSVWIAFIHKDASPEQKQVLKSCLNKVTSSPVWKQELLKTASAPMSLSAGSTPDTVIKNYVNALVKYAN
jgi:tripartite-type tricarboxylate transporter receptor subunit TctC